MKRFIRKSLLLCIVPLVIILMYSACPQYVGMGAGIDILPPEGEITYPDAGETPIRGSFVIKGTAKDDDSIKSVSLVLENIDTKKRTGNFHAEISKNSANTAVWKVFVPNERKPKFPGDPHPLVAEYPISDGEYTAIVTVTDNNGKESRFTKNFKIDNTPPVFIVLRPSSVTKAEDGAAPAIIDGYGAVFSVVAQAGEKNIVEELLIRRTDNQHTVTAKFIGKTINAAFPASTDDYRSLQKFSGTDTDPVIEPVKTRLFLADNARIYNDTGDTGSGNRSEWYYLRDDIYFDVLSKGYTPEIISDYFAGKRGSGTDAHSRKLNELWSDSPDAITARQALKDKRIMTADSPGNLSQSIFKLNPRKSPGFSIPRVTNISETAETLPSVDSVYLNESGERAIEVQLRPNLDGNPLFTSTSAADYRNSKNRIYLYKPLPREDNKKLEALKLPVFEGPGKNIEKELLFDFSKIKDEEFGHLIKVENNVVTVTCKLAKILDAGIYELVLKKAPDSPDSPETDAADTQGNKFEAYNETNKSYGGKVVFKLTYVGAEPRIFPKPIGEDQKYKNADFTVEADLTNGGPERAAGATASEEKQRKFEYRVYRIVNNQAQEISGSPWKSLEFVSGDRPEKESRFKAKIAIDELKTGGSYIDGEYQIKFWVKTVVGKEETASLGFMLDTAAPEPRINFPEPDNPQAGVITVSGQITDRTGSGVKPEGTKYIIGKQSGTVTPDTAGWRQMEASTAASWSFKADLSKQELKTHPENFGMKVPSSDNLYDIPVYILTEDKIGNKNVYTKHIRFDKDGTTPTVQVISPSANATLGGAVYMFGTAKTAQKGPAGVKEVYIQFSTTETFNAANCNINGENWWGADGIGKKITFQNSWNITINGNGKFNPPGSTGSWDIYFRLRAKNSDDQWGNWTEPQKITIDKDSPQITDIKLIDTDKNFDTTDGEPYVSNMWICRGKKLKAFLEDDSGIKSVSIKSDEFSMDYTVTNDPKGLLTAKPLSTGSDKNNYELMIPFDLDTLSEDVKKEGKFAVTVDITDNGTPARSTSRTFEFRFDITDPAGDFGEAYYIHSANFTSGTSITDTVLAGKIREKAPSGDYTNVKLLIGNTPVQISSVNSSTVTFSPAVEPGEHNYILYTKRKLIYNYSGKWMVNGVANDTGSGVQQVEVWVQVGTAETKHCIITESDSVNRISRQLGDQSTWQGAINLEKTKDNSPFPDGKGRLHYKITDKSGNIYEKREDGIIVKNNPVQIKKLVFMTDLSGNGVYEDSEKFEIQPSPSDGSGVLNPDRDFRGTADVASSFTFKNPAKSALEVTLSGGTGTNAIVSLLCDSIDGTSIVSATRSIESGDYTVILDLSNQFGNMGADDPQKKLFVKVTDKAINDPAGTPPWHAQADIMVGLDVKDEVEPRGVIFPFFYNSDKIELIGAAEEKLSSVKYDNGKPAGHIELASLIKRDSDGKPVLVGGKPQLYWSDNNYPSVSGTVILRGIAYDNIRLKKLELSGAGISVSNEFTNTGWSSSSALKVVKNNLSNTGHYVEWEYEWNTGTPAKAQTVTLKVTDDAHLPESGGGFKDLTNSNLSNTEPGVQTGTRGPEDRALTLAGTDKAVKYQFIRLTDEKERHYLVQVNEVNSNNKVNWFNIDVPQNIKKYVLYTADSNNAQITVNIVPYITKIKTKLSDLSNNESVYNRTALGRYPVSEFEKTPTEDEENQVEPAEGIIIEGFNLSGAVVELNGTPLTENAGVWGKKYKIGSAASGALIAKAGGIESINNINDNTKVYNKEPNNVNNDLLTDDRFIDVWQFKTAATPANGFISYPVLKVSPKDGSVGLAYANGVTYFNMAGFDNVAGKNGYKSARQFDMNWAQYVHTDFTFDEHGYTYGMATGVDMNTAGNVASYSKFVSRRPGTIAQLNNMGNNDGSGSQNGIGLRLENIGTTGSPYTVDPDRIQSPSITTIAGNSENEETFIYLAYYDTINQHIRYRWGAVTKKTILGIPQSPFHQYEGQLIDLKGYGKMQEPPASSFSILAGPPAKKYSSDTGGSTQAGAANNSGKYVSLAAVKASTAGTTHDRVTAVWYNAKARSLMYAHTTGNPRTDNVTWSTPVKISSGGEYVRSVTDPDGGIHVAFYDSGNLKYAYKPKGDSAVWSVVIVDSYSLTGTHVSIDLARAKTDGKWIPYISYYMQGGASAKLAYLVDETAPSDSGAGSIKAGAGTDERFTGAWEVSIIPVDNAIREYRINVGVYKDSSTGVIQAIPAASGTVGTDEWIVGGNGTLNPILGYAVVKDGAFETAQKK